MEMPSIRGSNIRSVRRSPRRLRYRSLRQLIGTSLVLVLGSSVGFAAGIVSAELYPASAQDLPPLEQWLRLPTQLMKQRGTDGRATIILPSDNLFADGKSRLRAEGVLILNQVADELATYPNIRVIVSVHTDNVGEAADDRQLSLMQARVVQQYLAEKLQNDQRWTVVGYGASQPIADNTTNAGRQRNRRVELTLSIQ